MDRFVAMIWDQTDPSPHGRVNAWSATLQRQSPKWKCVLNRPGLRVFSYHHRGAAPVVTRWQGDEGIVVGVMFKRGEEKKGRVLKMDHRDVDRINATRGDRLIKDYWGNYVAIWRDVETHQTTVLRDPCAAVACFTTRQKGVQLFFAHAEDVAAFPELTFTIDWTFLQAFLLWQNFATEHTGLNEVKEVLTGQRLEIARSGEKRFSWAWTGAEVAGEPNLQDFDDARAELRATAETCFTAWGKEYRNTLVELSGGLDSSIVLNLLRRVSDTRITALHFVSSGYEAYELKLARLSAAKADVELLEPQVPINTDLRRMFDLPRTMRPALNMLVSETHSIMIEAAEGLGADSFMSGVGGDQLFTGNAGNTLSDHIWHRGLGPMFWRVAYQTAMLTKSSIWEALDNAINALVLRRTWQPYAFLEDERFKQARLLRREVIDSLPEGYFCHPWLTSAACLPPGMAEHVKDIISLQDYHMRRGYGLERDALIPLFCQPLTEFALRTPTEVLGQGGLSRALERRTFADLIPGCVSRRVNKGTISHTVLRQFEHNLDFCRDLILGGEFAAHGWIDPAMTNRALSAGYWTDGKGAGFVYALLAIEAWAARWRAGGVRIAA